MLCRGIQARVDGFTRVELLLLSLAVFGLMMLGLGLVLPSWTKPRVYGQPTGRSVCVRNMKSLGLAFQLWSHDYDDAPPEARFQDGFRLSEVFAQMSNYITSPKVFACPSDPRRRPSALNFQSLVDRNVSYGLSPMLPRAVNERSGWISLRIVERHLMTNGVPLSAGTVDVQAGDRMEWDVRPHDRQGQVGLVDGSVQALDNLRLAQQSSVWMGQTTNAALRLVLP